MQLSASELELFLVLLQEKYGLGYSKECARMTDGPVSIGALQAKLSVLSEIRTAMNSVSDEGNTINASL